MNNKKHVLELFSGTHSVGKVCRKRGYTVISVDITDHCGVYIPTFKCDIMDFDYKKYPKDHFDIIWASPPCRYYSVLQHSWYGRTRIIDNQRVTFTKEIHEKLMNQDDRLSMKALEIINYFKPKMWFIENPESSQLKNREHMKNLPYYTVSYCHYNFPYRKHTRIWTNVKGFKPKYCRNDCDQRVPNTSIHKEDLVKHKKHLNCVKVRMKHKSEAQGVHKGRGTTKLERYRIPPDLIEELIKDADTHADIQNR